MIGVLVVIAVVVLVNILLTASYIYLFIDYFNLFKEDTRSFIINYNRSFEQESVDDQNLNHCEQEYIETFAD
ncbi:hypothetical protein [Acetohalobium arabaticum]|uniref:Uncharacterized protein n=1 Tax=Acetohalobium arabaticum (strain ATCC 49924 / DSM 5501 / Z-7288) TaxID=574087 RepID=D9QST7_ACEAZ|nr:hypothetical protein [Acetohalobium arabaticum]ADL11625.1 hypothetical protein Acear_0074 [Acetohalobium arabaticum DSM 5501]